MTIDTTGLADIFDLDPEAWSPRPAVFRVAHEALTARGESITPQQLYRLLRSRGFTESQRRGRGRGFGGIRVPESIESAGRLVPENSASAYAHRGDRSPAARHARRSADLDRWHRRLRASTPDDTTSAIVGHAVDQLTAPTERAEAIDAALEARDRSRRALELRELRRQAAETESTINTLTGGADLPAHHFLARRLRDLREQIESRSSTE